MGLADFRVVHNSPIMLFYKNLNGAYVKEEFVGIKNQWDLDAPSHPDKTKTNVFLPTPQINSQFKNIAIFLPPGISRLHLLFGAYKGSGFKVFFRIGAPPVPVDAIQRMSVSGNIADIAYAGTTYISESASGSWQICDLNGASVIKHYPKGLWCFVSLTGTGAFQRFVASIFATRSVFMPWFRDAKNFWVGINPPLETIHGEVAPPTEPEPTLPPPPPPPPSPDPDTDPDIFPERPNRQAALKALETLRRFIVQRG